jgi:multidrug resistance efflux pump
MNQSTRLIGVIVVVVVVLVAGVWWSQASKAAPAGHLLVAGDVRPEIRTVTAPAISYPTPDYTVGIPSSPTASPAHKPGGAGAPHPPSSMPVVAGMIKSVSVREGDHVKAGQVLVTFDPTMLNLGVAQAKTAATKARRDVIVLGKNLDKLSTASGKLASARGKLATAKSGLLKAKAALLKARKQLLAQQQKLLGAKAQRPQLQAALAALKAQAATFPPGHVPPALQKQITSLTALLAAIDPGLKAIAAGLTTIDTNLAKVNKGLAMLPAASAQISSAASKLADAKKLLRNAKDVLGIVADGQQIAIYLAEAKRAMAIVRSPVDGVVTFARRSGTVAMVGAPLVRIHTDGPQRVDTYLTAEQLAQVEIGSQAEITYDSGGGTVAHGAISEFGAEYLFPPTSFPTQIVHMTRALKVTIKLDEGSTAPPGTPVDVSIHTKASQ